MIRMIVIMTAMIMIIILKLKLVGEERIGDAVRIFIRTDTCKINQLLLKLFVYHTVRVKQGATFFL